MLIVLDTNCFINAVSATAVEYGAARRLLAVSPSIAQLAISRHSLHELERRVDAALALARGVQQLSYYPVGTISELLGSIHGLAGTLDDMKDTTRTMGELGQLARARADIRDKGALLDAILAKASMFVTSDHDLVGAEPAARIGSAFRIGVLTPTDALVALHA
jgi:predicted nucleic acid-binding protein